ncbi:hypothetical protein AV530_000644 [Patagioenas fasciata monilis]|uniref:Uncharacterized protein n=1 Tax=Patagioenas fasciata monilis TaxID=372326 RepID=A0A1V4IG70_PATFA|nr:hypothetical protein AV530_000644 [Patagioenas fasciata monilis]
MKRCQFTAPCSAWPRVTTCASHGSSRSHIDRAQNSPSAFLGDAGAEMRGMCFAMLSTHPKIEYGMK